MDNVPLEDIARYEVGGSIAILVNTAPAAFWTLLILYSHPGLLDDVRKEVDACTTTTTTETGTTVRALDINVLKESFPSALLVPGGTPPPLHGHNRPNIEDFEPRRFLPEEKQNRPRDVCFRAFGGGKTLCPGRHFATNEVLAVVAVFIVRFDMKSVEGGGRMPTTVNTNVTSVVMEPDDDVQVEIKTRAGFEDVEWAINLDELEILLRW
ncbi:Uu.00g128010.m01.CDS01 [Anthostomella pinea]|uniref:Uu.00g128010.m01.CDS01 n=1 Tax=Anthostomella pinea TaxID=933095 RepID=A0AAI8VCX9_9PEZI|nr:Uu.00g128010.m01.CDS01 [Anthostomella pinea]